MLKNKAIACVLSTLLALLMACGVAPKATATLQAIANPATDTPTAINATPTIAATATIAPTATMFPTVTVKKTTPEPGAAPEFAFLGDALADYLDKSGGDIQALEAALNKWQFLPQAAGGETSFSSLGLSKAVVTADLDGNQQEEVIIAAEDSPASEGLFPPSALLILDRVDGQYRVVYDNRDDGESFGLLTILSTEDVNGDAAAELTYGITSCGANTCFLDLRVLSYQDGEYANLTEGLSFAYPDEIRFLDEDNNDLKELAVHGNTFGSVGAGPQRASTMIYKLVNGRFQLSSVLYDNSDLLYFKVIDGNIALAGGELDNAIAYYQEALSNSSLQASGIMMNGMSAEEEMEALRSFANFRVMVAWALKGDLAAAEAAQKKAVAGGPYAGVAKAFWQGFSAKKDVDTGCQAAAVEANRDSLALDIINSFGYSNPYFEPSDICRGTGTMEGAG